MSLNTQLYMLPENLQAQVEAMKLKLLADGRLSAQRSDLWAGLEARIDLSITDDWPLAQAFVVISAAAAAPS